MRSKKVLVLLLIGVLFTSMVKFTPRAHAAAGWLEGYDQRIPIDIDHDDVDGALSDFPVLLVLSESSGITSADVTAIFDEVGANDKKIAVTTDDGETELYVEIEEWDDTGEEAYLWVKVTSVASGSDTRIYFYFDKDVDDNTAYIGDLASAVATNVWDSSFKLVWHMTDETTSTVLDSTGGYNGTKVGADEPDEVTSPIYRAQDFDGADDWIILDSLAALTFSGVTLEAWFNADSSGLGKLVILYEDDDQADQIHIYTDADQLWHFYRTDGVTVDESKAWTDTGNWNYFATMRTGTAISGFLNGTYDAAWDGTVGAGTIQDLDNCEIGAYSDTSEYNGRIDELRLSSTYRGAAWVGASYETGTDDFVTWGSLETPPTFTDNVFLSGFYFENGTKAPAGTATVTLANGSSLDYELNGTTADVQFNQSIVRVTWPIEYGGYEAIRFIDFPDSSNVSLTLYVPEDDFDAYVFTIRDYTGRLGIGASYIEAWRVINASSEVIERKELISTLNEEVLQLVIGKIYAIKIRFADNTTADFGLITLTTDTTITLPILDLAFSQRAQITFKYVTVEATRPIFTTIVTKYNDTRLDTNWANVTIEYLNGSKVVSANYSTDAFTYTWLSAVHDVTYKVRIEFDHGEFGFLPDVVTFLEGNVTYADTPDLGAAGTIGAMDTTDLLGMILIAVVIGAGTYRNSEAVLIAAALIAAMFSATGFVSFDVTLIEVVIGIVLIYNLVRSAQ